ncbi:GNAT family N-acetyltransferase [Embleya scabrispora]|uniref:GNAT family N-acetyltransferase n=1 Tax=Embleya scabrispora TaxID=159449 RepID=UPI00037D1379|nr:GNAT family N-acetyltransferase [Embleya scabrispora]MYS84284.1 GNAT family N-acetyltransferase [Streptomyces sp. SID5474]
MTTAAAATTALTIVPMRPEHADRVLAIYQLGIDTGDATFQESAPEWAEFDAGKLPDHRFVALDEGTGAVLGWVAASETSKRAVYRGVVETSIYVHPDASGRGVGRALLAAQVASTEAAGVWTIQAGIFPENTGSLALHTALGFRIIGTRERVGRHHDRWRDVTLLERRSPTID